MNFDEFRYASVGRFHAITKASDIEKPLAELVVEVESAAIMASLDLCNGHLVNTAAMLGVNRFTLRKKMREFGIEHPTKHGSAKRSSK